MILGNSNGNNKGKKYFKEKDKCPSECFPVKAKHFSDWFVVNIRPLQVQLFNKYKHPANEDVFNETYLRIYERIYYTGFKIADYKSYFCRAFYTNHIQELTKTNRYAELDSAVSFSGEDTNEDEEIERKYTRLEEDIFDYVYRHFEIREYEIFKMYMRLKIQGKNMTYHVLADIIRNEEYKVHDIQAIISKIKKEVCGEFSDRWDK